MNKRRRPARTTQLPKNPARELIRKTVSRLRGRHGLDPQIQLIDPETYEMFKSYDDVISRLEQYRPVLFKVVVRPITPLSTVLETLEIRLLSPDELNKLRGK